MPDAGPPRVADAQLPEDLQARVERDVDRLGNDAQHPNVGDCLRDWARDLYRWKRAAEILAAQPEAEVAAARAEADALAEALLPEDLQARVRDILLDLEGEHYGFVEDAINSLVRELAAARAEVQVLRAARTLERADKHDAQEDATALAAALRTFCEDTECGDGFQLADGGEHDCHEFQRWRFALAVLARHARGSP